MTKRNSIALFENLLDMTVMEIIEKTNVACDSNQKYQNVEDQTGEQFWLMTETK